MRLKAIYTQGPLDRIRNVGVEIVNAEILEKLAERRIANMRIIPPRHVSFNRCVLDPAIPLVPPKPVADSCPDCYIGFSGQLEPCEKCRAAR